MYLSKIEMALQNAQNLHAVDTVWRVCRDILREVELTSEEEIIIKGFKDRIGKMNYIHPHTYKIDSSKLYYFREEGMELIRFIHNKLGLN